MSIKEKVNEVLDKTTIDDKIIDGAKNVKKSVKKTVDAVLDKTTIDDKIKEKVADLKEKKKNKEK